MDPFGHVEFYSKFKLYCIWISQYKSRPFTILVQNSEVRILSPRKFALAKSYQNSSTGVSPRRFNSCRMQIFSILPAFCSFASIFLVVDWILLVFEKYDLKMNYWQQLTYNFKNIWSANKILTICEGPNFPKIGYLNRAGLWWLNPFRARKQNIKISKWVNFYLKFTTHRNPVW